MSELAKLGAIIDGLLERRRKNEELDRRLVFVVGNGIDNVNNILNDEKLRREAGRRYRQPASFESFKWRRFEYARYYTSNSLPSLAHCLIWNLVQTGLCREIITTNYDLFFDTIWRRFSTNGIRQNPVLEKGEYDWEEYYSAKARAKPCYWKIHGSLSHVCFQPRDADGQTHLHRLPRFAISRNDDRLARSFKIPTQAPSMRFEAARFPGARFTNLAGLKASFSPFIDWTYANERTRFQREIEAAKAVLRTPKSIAALVLLGFSGYYNAANDTDLWNEELVPEIEKLMKKGFSRIFMAIHSKQADRIAKPPYGLMRVLADANRCWTYEESGGFVEELLNRYSRKFPYDYLVSDYERWMSLYEPKGEAAHVDII